MGLSMMPLGTHVLNSAPRDLVSRVTSLTGSCQNVVSSLAIASFATLLQVRAAALAGGGLSTPVAEAAAYGDIYRTSVVILALACVMTLTLRRSDTPAEARRPAPELVSSAT
jgi:hypothetical protein